MLDYQQKIVDRMKRYVAQLEAALNEERWADADEAALGLWLANDEMQRTLPHNIAGDDPGIFG